jgi:hypothetical protein
MHLLHFSPRVPMPMFCPGMPSLSGRVPPSRSCVAAPKRPNVISHGWKPVERKCCEQTDTKEFFFTTFKAGMLLKIRESLTKYTNFERLLRRKCEGFAIFRTNCSSFSRFDANPEVYWGSMCPVPSLQAGSRGRRIHDDPTDRRH